MKSFLVIFTLLLAGAAMAEEPYFVTYSHHMEEPGNLEIGTKAVVGSPKDGNTFVGNSVEFEYGLKGWWTTEFYLDGQTTAGQSTVFTGWRFENRFRPLMREHWINPVLYLEYENLNSANKSLLEVVGHDVRTDFLGYNDNSEKEHELELKLILGSDFKGWNISENFIAEKNLGPQAWEFGYALGASRPLSLKASPKACVFCAENFSVGAELYGGLGDWHSFGLKDTSHYFAPLLGFRIPNGPSFKISPGIGLNDNSHGTLLRFGVTYEIEQIANRLKRH